MTLISRPLSAALIAAGFALGQPVAATATPDTPPASTAHVQVTFGYETIDGVKIAYREAGDPSKPTVLLLHGFPTSSHMFRNLMPALARDYHVLAPDYPGFGASDMPLADAYDYTFDQLAGVVETLIERKGIDTYALYLMDYGAPVGYRIFSKAPDRVTGFIIQNGNAYAEGLMDFWDPLRAYWAGPSAETAAPLRAFLSLEATKWQFTHGTRDPDAISPDNYWHVQYLLDRPGNQDVQLELFLDYGTNLAEYPKWQALFREYQPPALIVWGKNDHIFPADGAYPYRRDLKDVEFHLLDTGHFALEEDGQVIAEEILDFMDRITNR
ncbi:MAG: alpha/beta fold hydrolase [Roseibium sp.]|nr:alpha/beta fold hydrolase [Roseibium sp.]